MAPAFRRLTLLLLLYVAIFMPAGSQSQCHAAAAAATATGTTAAATTPAAGIADPYGPAPRINVGAAALLDPVTGQLLYGYNAFRTMAPASTTKIMTCLVVLERCSLDEVVTISSRATGTSGAHVGLRTGQQIPVQDLLFGLMLKSGNDAAVALAEHVAGSVEDFADLMNERARQIGALATTFRNPHGLTQPNHVTTAYDLALIAREAMENPVFRVLVSSRDREIGSLDPTWTRLISSTNRLLWVYEGAEGIKTGTTDLAGKCLVASATRDGRRLIAVCLRASDRFGDTARLLDYGFEHTALFLVGLEGEAARSAEAVDPLAPEVFLGQPPRQVPLLLTLGDNLAFNLKAGEQPRVELTYSLDGAAPRLVLPLAAGQAVGTVTAHADGIPAAVARLVCQETIPRGLDFARLLRWLTDLARLYIGQGLR